MRYFHLVARSHLGIKPLVTTEVCRWTWQHLAENFEQVAACVLMPDHLHLIAAGEPAQLRLRLSGTLQWLTRTHFPRKQVWDPVPEPEPVRDSKHLLRQIRYVHLNPCRSLLARDPLEWEWSTHRDWTGFVVVPWPNIESVRGYLGWSAKGIDERMHRYVSSDPTVSVTGTPLSLPTRTLDQECRALSAQWVMRAVGVAYRKDSRPEAMRYMSRNTELKITQVAKAFGVARQSAWGICKTPSTSTGDAIIARILGDSRVLNCPVDPTPAKS